MSEEKRFEPVPGVAFLCGKAPTEIVEVVVKRCPPCTPAPSRPDRPHLPKKLPRLEEGPGDTASAGA
jgi:hypothetical protein